MPPPVSSGPPRVPEFRSPELRAIAATVAARHRPGSRSFELTLPGLPPSANAAKAPSRKRGGVMGMRLEKDTRDYYTLVGQLGFGKTLAGEAPLMLLVEIISPDWLTKDGSRLRCKRDLDNFLKVLQDALAKALKFNDARIAQVHLAKSPGVMDFTRAALFEIPWMLESAAWQTAQADRD